MGFNIKRFDYRVLQPYTKVRLAEVPTLDMLEEVYTSLGTRLSLNHLAEKTLGEKKSGDGLLALELFAEGRWEELDSYCRQDVALTHRLFQYGAAARLPHLPAPPGRLGAAAGGLAGRAVFRQVKRPGAP